MPDIFKSNGNIDQCIKGIFTGKFQDPVKLRFSILQ